MIETEEIKHSYFWLSFCDTNKEKGQQFLGVIITNAVDIASAISKTWRLGINPGGEVEVYQISTDIINQKIDSNDIDKLLTKTKAIKYSNIL